MKVFLRSFLASFLALVVLIALGLGLLSGKIDRKSKIEKHSWLHIDLYGAVYEYDPPGGVLGQITGGDALTLQKILENLAKAAVDERISGVILQMSSSHNAGSAKLQEIRDAVQRLQESGKPVYGYADAMDNRTYYLASVCDSLYCPPSAYITFTGFDVMSTHLKGALEKLGVTPQLHVIRHYKAAAQLLTRDDLSPEARRNREWMLADLGESYLEGLAAGRGLDAARVEELMMRALLTADEAVASGLFDRTLYWDELEAMLKEDKEDHLRVVSQQRYADEDPADLDLKGDKTIAVIHAQGNIGGRENGVHPVLGLMMGHETIVGELMRALHDDDVAAVVLRVDSGGGDSLTSDLIGHAVAHVARSKPVVVSMVDVAASGGYSVSYRASRILADPMSVTGSIGSISGKFDLSDLHEKLGLTTDHVSLGPRARMMASDRPFTAEEWELYGDNHWRDFRRWMMDVAAHRGIAAADIDSLCMGRVWTGRQASANGLIDEVGGQYEAVEVAKQLAGLAADEEVSLWHLPEKQDLVQMIFGGDDAAGEALSWALYRRLQREAAVSLDLIAPSRLWMMDPALMP